MTKPVAIVKRGFVNADGIAALQLAGYVVVVTHDMDGVVLSDRTLRDEFVMAALTGLAGKYNEQMINCQSDLDVELNQTNIISQAFALADLAMDRRNNPTNSRWIGEMPEAA